MLNFSQQNMNQDCFSSQLPSNDNSHLSGDQDMWIQSFLNSQALIKHKKDENWVSQNQQIKIIQKDQIQEQKEEQGTKPTCKSTRSIFHNFQKHLIVLLKKMDPLKKQKLAKTQYGHIAYKLWKLFLETHSYNKKTLRIILGSANICSNQMLIDEMVKQFPTLKPFYQNYSAQLISQAQKLLRDGVVEQSKHINLKNLQSKTKMTSQFDKFYQYFRNFVHELEQGSLTLRISKKNKDKIISKINNSQQ